jgi:hypothetical protein
MQSLEDILNNSGPAPVASNPEPRAELSEQPEPPETEENQEPQETAEPATGDGREADDPAAPPAAQVEEPLDKRIAAFQSKAEDEKRKRQDYEKQLQETKKALDEREAYIQQVQQWWSQQQQQHAEPEVDLYDPDQARGFISNQLRPITDQIFETRVLLSQEMYRSAHPDYDEMETIFADECDRDPSLRQQLVSHPVPAKFAFEQGKRIKLMRELSDPDAYRAKLREEIMAELQSQQQPQTQHTPPQVQTPAKPVPQPPKSLAGVPSASRNPVKHPWGGPTPLEQLLS